MRRVMALCAALLCAPALVQAQEEAAEEKEVILERPGPDQGYYLTAGLNFATSNVVDEGDSLPTLLGWGLTIHVGQSVVSWMDLGLVIDIVRTSGDLERSSSLNGLGFEWSIRPYEPLIFRLGASFGIANTTAPTNSDNDGFAFGALVGVTAGYSFFPTHDPGETGSFAITPTVSFKGVQPFSSDSAYVTMVGVEFTWWSGLPNRMLDLSLEEAFPTDGDKK